MKYHLDFNRLEIKMILRNGKGNQTHYSSSFSCSSGTIFQVSCSVEGTVLLQLPLKGGTLIIMVCFHLS